MGFFTDNAEPLSTTEASSSRRPLKFSPGTYIVRFEVGINVPDAAYHLYGAEFTVTEVLQSFSEGQLGPANTIVGEATRPVGSRVSAKTNLKMKWPSIPRAFAANLAHSLIKTAGFEEAMKARDGYWAAFSTLGDEERISAVADLVMEDPELFAGLSLKATAEELRDKDGQRRANPMCKVTFAPVS